VFPPKPPNKPHFNILPADLARDGASIAWLRRRVFIEEQGVPEALEWEPEEPGCDWFLARVALVGSPAREPVGPGSLIGIVRLTPTGRIGRMAVLPDWRRQGVASALLLAVLARAGQRGLDRVHLHAQISAVPLYVRHGFRPVGAVFQEAGIPHQAMALDLNPQNRKDHTP